MMGSSFKPQTQDCEDGKGRHLSEQAPRGYGTLMTIFPMNRLSPM